jgi:aminopeptidase-like protein
MVTMDDRDEQVHTVDRGRSDVHDAAQSRKDRVLGRLTRVLPIGRSLTGDGVRATLAMLAEELPIDVHEIASGTTVLDWTVPDEWNLRRATLVAPDGTVVADSDVHPLHVVGYSEPVDVHLDRAALDAHLHSLPDRPDAIPYRTSYYHRTWGFCVPHRVREALPDGTYHARIDATLAPGSLTWAQLVIPGRGEQELLLTTHICHPAMANDNASGIAVLAEVARELLARAEPLQHTVRCLFLPGSLGAIAWLATHRDVVPRVAGGLVLTGLGDRGPLHYKRSQRGDTPVDRAAELVLAERGADLDAQVLDFSPYGYDERQFCSPGFDLAVGRLTRGVHGTYPEYHTSLDDLAFVDATQLDDAVDTVCTFVDVVDRDRTYVNLAPYGEPQLGRRGLYATVGGMIDARSVEMGLLWVLNQSNGTRSLVDIARRSGLPFRAIASAADALVSGGLLEEIDGTSGGSNRVSRSPHGG